MRIVIEEFPPVKPLRTQHSDSRQLASGVIVPAMTAIPSLPQQYRRLLAFIKPYRGRLITGIAFGVAYGPLNVAVLAVVKKVWARFFEQGVTGWTWWQAAAVAADRKSTRLNSSH